MKRTSVFSLLILLSGASQSEIIRIPQDYTAFQAGIEAAQQGDTILVAEGTYMENLRIDEKKLTIGSFYLTTGLHLILN